MYFRMGWSYGIRLDGVVYHRPLLLEVNDGKDPVIPCRNVNWDDHKVIMLENFKFRGPCFDIVMREYAIRCHPGVPVCTSEVASGHVWIRLWG